MVWTNWPIFSFFSFFSSAVSGVASAFGVSTASSSLVTFAAAFLAVEAFGLAGAFFLVGSVAGVLGVDNLSFVLVLGVFAGW